MTTINKTSEETPLVTLPLGGRKFQLRKLSANDRDELVEWVRRHHIAVAKEIAEGLSDEDRRAVLLHAVDRTVFLTFDSPEVAARLMSREGVSKVLWMSVRGADPTVTEEQVREWLNDPETLQACAVAIMGTKQVEPLKAKAKSRKG